MPYGEVVKSQCPRCAAQGRDRSGDNLAIYADGHEYCFSCNYYVPAPPSAKIKQMSQAIRVESNKAPDIIKLPFDASPNFSPEILSRLTSWGITMKDIEKHKLMWSDMENRLVMPVYDQYGQLLMYQARSFTPGAIKYLTKGGSSDILHILQSEPEGPNYNECIILVEDLISAIRISHYKPAMPLWGNDIPLKTIRRLATRYHTVGVWLDPDMRLKSIKDVLRINQYVPAFVITSNLDPKLYSLENIKEHIDLAAYEMFYKDQPTKTFNNHSAEK